MRQTVEAVWNSRLRPTVLMSVLPFIRYKAVYNYKPQNSDELELREGDVVQVVEKCDDGWFVGMDFFQNRRNAYLFFLSFISSVSKIKQSFVEKKNLVACNNQPALLIVG